MKLFCDPISPYARKVMILARLSGIELHKVKAQKNGGNGYMAGDNPLGKIPALEWKAGQFLFDSPVICEYLDSQRQTPLLPESGDERIIQLWQHALGDGLSDAVYNYRMETVRPADLYWDKMIARHDQSIRNAIDTLEQRYEPYKVKPEYLAEVKAFDIPDMPVDWTWDMFVSEDGVKMRYGQTGNISSARATVVMIPGYTATMDMYGEQVEDIAARGYHVIGFDLRGQGGSERPRPSQPEKLLIDDFKIYSNDLALFLQSLDLPEDRPVILMAMSFGGHVAFRVGAEHSDLVDGLLLLAPALRPKSGDMSFDQMTTVLRIGDALGRDRSYLPGQTNWVPASEDDLLVYPSQ